MSLSSMIIAAKLPWIFPGARLKINGASGNGQGNLTGMHEEESYHLPVPVQRWEKNENIYFIFIKLKSAREWEMPTRTTD